MGYHLVRYGLQGRLGHFVAADASRYERRSRVVLRSGRGLELGEVLSHQHTGDAEVAIDGQILRRMTVEDELLEARLEKHRDEAFHACADLLSEQGVPATLMDVEHLFDGAKLFFYFLGDVPPEAEELTAELANTYETTVEFQRFAKTLSEGCGPGCGTEEAMGQGGCESCTTCAVASACGSLKK